MADTLVLLHVEHRNFLRVLAVLDGLTEAIRRTGTDDVELLKQIMAYFQGFPDRCHHPKEDLVFRRLREVDPGAADSVGDLLAEHEEVSGQVAEISRRVNAYGGGSDPDLADALASFVAAYREHLWEEEGSFFPAAESQLAADDWAAIDFTLFDRDDPVFDLEAEQYYRQLRRAILPPSTP